MFWRGVQNISSEVKIFGRVLIIVIRVNKYLWLSNDSVKSLENWKCKSDIEILDGKRKTMHENIGQL